MTSGGEFFIVDNSESEWKGLRYLEQWTEMTADPLSRATPEVSFSLRRDLIAALERQDPLFPQNSETGVPKIICTR
jgi:hypothetical protein